MADDVLAVLRVVRDPAGLAGLLAPAGDAESAAELCRCGWTAFVLTDLAAARGDDVVAVALCGPPGSAVELRLPALQPDEVAGPAGRRLLDGTLNALRAAGAERVWVAVAPSDAPRLTLLDEAGFRPERATRPDDGDAGDGGVTGSSGASLRLVLDL